MPYFNIILDESYGIIQNELNSSYYTKEQGYFIRGIYVLTSNVDINVARISAREALGGHGVPEEKVRARYVRALKLIPKLVEICDILHVYDNTSEPFRIFKKRKDVYTDGAMSIGAMKQ